ncbi:MAG TPA: YraN family protein [Candidatus Methylomirabilis sp.]|nr:YraN family protein [Candidatus Methylomirabilis sp.]
MGQYRKKIGHFGENLARNFLQDRGYVFVSSNQKIGCGELDLIMKQREEYVFVEVKTIASQILGPAAEALTRRQINQLKKTLRIYCRQNRINIESTRLDLIAINLNRIKKIAKLRHFKNIY